MGCLLAFAGFIKFNEPVHVCCCDLTVDEEIQIPRSKTDQLQKGNEVVIARLSEETCPVRMLERYIKVTKIRIDSEFFANYPSQKSESSCDCELHNNEGAIQKESKIAWVSH